MKKSRQFLLIVPFIFLFACSAGEQTSEGEEQKQPEIYMFDNTEKVDSSVVGIDTVNTEPTETKILEELPPEIIDTVTVPDTSVFYYVQVGAFSTKERAEIFIKTNQQKIEYQMNISFNEQTKLFVVQLPPFSTRESAEEIRNTLRYIPVFMDAFIITIEE